MILLASANKVLEETVASKIKVDSDAKKKRDTIDVRLQDFDDVSYHVVAEKAAANLLKVSMSVPQWAAIKDNGGNDSLEREFKEYVAKPGPDAEVALEIDLDKLDEKHEDELIAKIARMKQIVLGGVFDKYLTALQQDKADTLSNFRFALRADCHVFFVPKKERVAILFQIDFQDRTDLAIARVFLQEFVESRRTIGAAPPVSFGVNPPLELKAFDITEPTGGLGFVSFAILPEHVKGDKKDKSVEALSMFRNYLQYHIKCAKSFFHSRMRARVVSLLQVLNRAKTEDDEEVEKKTIAGKTFKRK